MKADLSKNKIFFSCCCSVFFIALIGCHSPNTATTISANNPDTTSKMVWQNLSDSNDLQWHTYGKNELTKAWRFEGNTLHLRSAVKDGWQTKDGGDIVTNKEYENFDLQLEWKISEGENSGIMFYVKEDTSKYKYPWETGPEMQICDNAKNEDGKVYKSRAGDLYELMAISKDMVKPAGEWNQIEIIANKGQLYFNINGEHVLSTTLWNSNWKRLIAGTKFATMPGFGIFKKGKIALQDHGADVWFRNIRIREL